MSPFRCTVFVDFVVVVVIVIVIVVSLLLGSLICRWNHCRLVESFRALILQRARMEKFARPHVNNKTRLHQEAAGATGISWILGIEGRRYGVVQLKLS
jgi:hypothetical protein